jgi:hypothetical protein
MKRPIVAAPVAAALCSGGVPPNTVVDVPRMANAGMVATPTPTPEPNQVLAAVGLARTLLHVCDGDLTTATTLLKAASPLEGV